MQAPAPDHCCRFQHRLTPTRLLPGCPWLQGTLRGYDQATNLILDECHERVYSSKARSGSWARVHSCRQQRVFTTALSAIAPNESSAWLFCPLLHLCCPSRAQPTRLCLPAVQSGVEQLVLGLYVIRGDNM